MQNYEFHVATLCFCDNDKVREGKRGQGWERCGGIGWRARGRKERLVMRMNEKMQRTTYMLYWDDCAE